MRLSFSGWTSPAEDQLGLRQRRRVGEVDHADARLVVAAHDHVPVAQRDDVVVAAGAARRHARRGGPRPSPSAGDRPHPRPPAGPPGTRGGPTVAWVLHDDGLPCHACWAAGARDLAHHVASPPAAGEYATGRTGADPADPAAPHLGCLPELVEEATAPPCAAACSLDKGADRTVRPILLAVVAVALLAACGRGDASPPPATRPRASTTPTSASCRP